MKTFLYITSTVDILEQKTKSEEINKEEHTIPLKDFKKISYNNHTFVIFYNGANSETKSETKSETNKRINKGKTVGKEEEGKGKGGKEEGKEEESKEEEGKERKEEEGKEEEGKEEERKEKNIINLPFIDFEIFGDFILYNIDNQNKIKSLTQSKLFKIISKNNKNLEEEYSSDDFYIESK